MQIGCLSRRGSLDIEHLGSAHDDAELEQLKAGRSTGPPSRRRTDPGPGDEWLARRYTGRELAQTGPGIVLRWVPAEPQNDPGPL